MEPFSPNRRAPRDLRHLRDAPGRSRQPGDSVFEAIRVVPYQRPAICVFRMRILLIVFGSFQFSKLKKSTAGEELPPLETIPICNAS